MIRTEDQIRRFEFGGNARLTEYLDKYDLNKKAITAKYKTRACDIYRKNVE